MDENPQGMELAIARQQRKRHLAALWASLAGLKPGMVVADIGCGPGVLTRDYAGMLGPEGVVYAVAAKAEHGSLIRSLPNVHILFQSFDLKIILEQIPHIVFLTDTLQNVAGPETVLRRVHAACGPDTKVLITGYDPGQPGLVGAKLHRRIPPCVLAAMVAAAGFDHGGVIDTEDEHYALIARKR